MNKKVSVIIPVHNGEKWIKKTASRALAQKYDNFELILVENGSSDNSWTICKDLKQSENRIIAIKSDEKGTSLARKKGVEIASGDYIVFLDQDDHYSTRTALAEMVVAIEKDNADITQFAYVQSRFGLYRQNKKLPIEHCVWDRKELLKGEVGGVMGIHRGCFNTTVWNKIYRTEVLKEAITHITEVLYYAEDENLNTWAFISPNTKIVSAINEAYYVWNSGTGFSSRKNSGEALLKDYEIVKKNAVDAIIKYCGGSQTMLWDIHGESLYCMRAVSMGMLRSKERTKEEAIQRIETFMNYRFIHEAKRFFNNYTGEKVVWEDLRFLASDYTAEEYYEYCLEENQRQLGIKSVIKKAISKISK